MSEQAVVEKEQVDTSHEEIDYAKKFKEMEEAQALLTERLDQQKSELSKRDSTISKLAEEKKKAELSKLSELETVQLEMKLIKEERATDKRLRTIAENKATALTTFETEGIPSGLIDFLSLDNTELISEQTNKLKTVVDSIKQSIADDYAKSHGDKVKTSVNLEGVSANDMKADELTKLFKSDPDKARAILAARNKRT